MGAVQSDPRRLRCLRHWRQLRGHVGSDSVARKGTWVGVMIVLGIDPGTHCGWAVLDTDHGRLASGVWDLSSRRHEGGGMRFVRLHQYLREIAQAYSRIGAVVYEEVRRHQGVDAAHV